MTRQGPPPPHDATGTVGEGNPPTLKSLPTLSALNREGADRGRVGGRAAGADQSKRRGHLRGTGGALLRPRRAVALPGVPACWPIQTWAWPFRRAQAILPVSHPSPRQNLAPSRTRARSSARPRPRPGRT